MLKNWCIYILTLIGSVVFFLFYQMWFAWYCIVLLLLIPPIALVMCLLSLRSARYTLEVPKTVRTGESADVLIRPYGKYFSFFSFCYIFLTEMDNMTDETRRLKAISHGSDTARVPVNTKHCGSMTYRIEKIRIYDLFGLFHYTRKKQSVGEVIIQPVPKIPEIMPDANGFKAKSLKRSRSPYSEIYDVRDYMPGDPVKNIHWKASAKKDKTLIKEPQEEVFGHARVFLSISDDRDLFDQRLGEMLFTSNYFLKKEIPHKIRVLPPMKRERAFDIQSQRDLDTAMIRILHLKIPKELADET
ncbi:MAG: DUF58 domain-containing protein [Clostridiales bacterium]|nr:DUF58 domain-containing protein [Clostridiales bacterium]MBR5936885.1 DUF58 domain-containing protein [Clostridiales bacterium]